MLRRASDEGRPRCWPHLAGGLLLLLGLGMLTASVSCGDSVSEVAGAGGDVVVPGEPCANEGSTDSCYPGTPVTQGIGECHDGTSTCVDGVWGECLGYQVPTVDGCNGLDDDCDGVVDEGCGGGGAGGVGGAGAGGAAGSGGAPPVGLQLYHRPFGAPGSSFSTQPVSQAWVGANAPPAIDIAVVEMSYGTTPPWLFVVAIDGMLYMRQGGTWLLPRAVELIFPGLYGPSLNSMTMWQPQAGGSQTVQFTATGGGTTKLAFNFDVVLPSLVVTPSSSNPITIEPAGDPDGPPQESVDYDWTFAHQTAHIGTPHWMMVYLQCGPNAYEFDGGNFDFADLGPAGQSWLWGGAPATGPTAGTVRAAWLDGSELYFLAP